MVVRHNLGEFSRRIRKVARDVPENADDILRTVALVANQTVILATPVDTGRARANWHVSIENPVTEATESTNFQARLDENASIIKSQSDGKALIISNNVEYIGALNAGSSAKAPAGFVEKALQAAANAVARKKVVR